MFVATDKKLQIKITFTHTHINIHNIGNSHHKKLHVAILGLIPRLVGVPGGAAISQCLGVLVVVHNVPACHPGTMDVGIKFIIRLLIGTDSMCCLKFVTIQNSKI